MDPLTLLDFPPPLPPPTRLCTTTVTRMCPRSDVWAFGVTCYETFTAAARPYEGMTNQMVLVRVKDGFRLPCPEGCPRQVYDTLMRPCWAANPTDRPTFAGVLEHALEAVGHTRKGLAKAASIAELARSNLGARDSAGAALKTDGVRASAAGQANDGAGHADYIALRGASGDIFEATDELPGSHDVLGDEGPNDAKGEPVGPRRPGHEYEYGREYDLADEVGPGGTIGGCEFGGLSSELLEYAECDIMAGEGGTWALHAAVAETSLDTAAAMMVRGSSLLPSGDEYLDVDGQVEC